MIRLSPGSIRLGFILGFLLLILLALYVGVITLAAGDDPFLQQPARYARLVLLCVAGLVPLAFILFLSLYLILRRRF